MPDISSLVGNSRRLRSAPIIVVPLRAMRLRCSNAHSMPISAMRSEPTTPRAPTSSGSSFQPPRRAAPGRPQQPGGHHRTGECRCRDAAIETARAFHRQLCFTRVLDPACGSGIFLYVSLEHMKRLEGEFLNPSTRLATRNSRSNTPGLRWTRTTPRSRTQSPCSRSCRSRSLDRLFAMALPHARRPATVAQAHRSRSISFG